MDIGITKNRRGFFSIIAILIVVEGAFFTRWLFFSGPQPSSFDWQFPLELLLILWGIGKISESFERREEQRNSRLRDIETRLEALYKWGSVYSADDEEDPNDLAQEEDLDKATKEKIAQYRKDIESGELDLRYHLGVTYWNLSMKHYNPHTIDGYRKAIYWLRKAAKLDYDCDSTLGDAYLELKEYDKAMLWYRRVVRRGDRLAYIAESNIAGMYAEGQGVLQNYAEAARWWSLAAEHGWRFANYDLGKLYAKGAEGLQQDNREAYFHLCIASSGNNLSGIHEQVFQLRDEVAQRLGKWEVSREQKRADEWLASHSKGAEDTTSSQI